MVADGVPHLETASAPATSYDVTPKVCRPTACFCPFGQGETKGPKEPREGEKGERELRACMAEDEQAPQPGPPIHLLFFLSLIRSACAVCWLLLLLLPAFCWTAEMSSILLPTLSAARVYDSFSPFFSI